MARVIWRQSIKQVTSSRQEGRTALFSLPVQNSLPITLTNMKNIILLGLAALSATSATAQNTAVVTQQGNAHELSVVQRGSGNTSVVNQTTAGSANRVVVTQSGTNNVATISQGGELTSSEANTQNTVTATQVGDGETIINQTSGGNTISVYQSGLAPTAKKKKTSSKRSANQ